jgi:hypothetical protein
MKPNWCSGQIHARQHSIGLQHKCILAGRNQTDLLDKHMLFCFLTGQKLVFRTNAFVTKSEGSSQKCQTGLQDILAGYSCRTKEYLQDILAGLKNIGFLNNHILAREN